MKINLLFATTIDGIFSLQGYLPWENKKDLLYFNQITTNVFSDNTLVMGKYTFMSLPKTFNNLSRKIIVLGKKCDYNTLEDFMNQYIQSENETIFMIGGKCILEDCLLHYKNKINIIYYNCVKSGLKENYHLGETFDLSLLFDFECINQKSTEEIDYYIYSMKQNEEYQYLNLLQKIIKSKTRETRNGVVYSNFGDCLIFDVKDKFPLLTTKKMFLRGIFEELMFFIRGQTNTTLLEDKNVMIWKGNTSNEFLSSCNLNYEKGDMGPMYGFQWRHFNSEYFGFDFDYSNQGVDQLEYCLDLLQNDMYSRRIIMTTYNPLQAKQGVLYPCHSIVIQFYVEVINNIHYVSISMYQRSVDVVCGLPFNIASTSLLLYLICNTLEYRTHKIYIPNKVYINLGDTHIYEEHIQVVLEQLERIPYDLPKLNIINKKDIEEYEYSDIEIINYTSHPKLSVSMIV